MPDDNWLWNQPKTWHDINRALQDISVLLDYLGTLPDGRLLSYFEDTQSRVADSAAKHTVPPCAGYSEFLSLIFKIGSAFQTGRPDLLPELPAPPHGLPLSAEAFLFWSRDFLAAVAAPATADSIRLTHDYIVRRARRRFWFRRSQSTPAAVEAPALPPDADEPVRKMLARRLALWVRFSEALTIVIVILTVAVSIYALSGKLILGNAQDMEQAWSKVDQQLEAQEDRLLSLSTQPAGLHERIISDGLCTFAKQAKATTTAQAETGAPVSVAVATTAGEIRSDAASPLIKVAPPQIDLISARERHLCEESDRVLLNLFTVTIHLQSWSSVATQRIGAVAHVPLAPLLGVSPASIAEYSRDRDGNICAVAFPDLYNKQAGASGCRELLLTKINGTHRIAESILASITLYILPVFYGFLGAMAAALRTLRRKVDACILSYTDRARLQQGAVLGILCGAVIGLFATYITKSGAGGGLGLSAIALLAGYNVDGVFRFLDELSDRVFRPSSAAKS
jgi:hypothetical protein